MGPTPAGRSATGVVGGGLQSYEESGVLSTDHHRGSRRGVGLLLCGALLFVPLLLLKNDSDASASVGTVHPPERVVAAGQAPRSLSVPRAVPASAPMPAPGGAPVSIAAVPVRNVVPTTTTIVPERTIATTAVAPVTPTTTTTTATTHPALVPGTQVRTSGSVTYYDHPAGRCASPWLPFGTVVQVTNPANGATVTCMVDDREADTARSIDLATATFAQIAPLWQGVVDARLIW